jgi:copper resistance protein B
MKGWARAGAVGLFMAASPQVWAQSAGPGQNESAPFGPPMDDQRVYVHATLEQFEYRAAGHESLSRWEGEAWLGTDGQRLWFKSEGEVSRDGAVAGGIHELLYDRPVSSYFDVQAGVRYDKDSDPGRTWAAVGVQGLAPYRFRVALTGYVGNGGRLAARAQGSCDLLISQRLILQPQLEVNLYSKADPERRIGSGVSELDAGLRLRYEITRKFAPYVGVSFRHAFAQTAALERATGGSSQVLSAMIGVRAWL